MKLMQEKDLLRNFKSYFFLIAILLVVPGNTSAVFNGLPLSSIPEMFGFLVLLLCIFSINLKSNFNQLSAKVKPGYLVATVLILGITIPIKVALKNSDLPTGRFDACYHSFVRSDDMKVPDCEPFFSAKFEGGRSRLDRAVNFQGLNYPLRDINVSGSNWNLSFVNNEQFMGRYGNFEQVRHPFRANWMGKFSADLDNGFIPVTYVGFGIVDIDSIITKLPVHYGVPRTEWIPVEKGIHSIRIDYSFTSLQMKPVNGVDYSSYGYYATLKVGAVQKTPVSRINTLFGWAVDPQTFQRLSKIELIENGKVVQQVVPATYRADVGKYLGIEFENPYVGFSMHGAQPNIGSRIIGISADGKRNVILKGDGFEWQKEPDVSGERLWYRIDDSFDSGQQYGVLQPLSARQGMGLLVLLVDYLIGLSVIALICLLAWSYRKFWKTYVILAAGIFSHVILFSSKTGLGHDGTEGSAILYTSAIVVIASLGFAILCEQRAFASAGIIGALYLAVDRIVHINPGMRYDHFIPVTGKSPASNLGAVFFRPAATDWLIHAANTRSSLFRGLLFGNEPVFYLQPGYRYFAPIFQFLFGDGDVRLSISVMFAAVAGLVLLLSLVVTRATKKTEKLLVIAFLVGALMFATSWVTSCFILVQTTEIPTWPLMLFGSYLLIRFGSTRVGLIVPGILFGLAVCMRPNQIIGHVFLLVTLSFLVDKEAVLRKKTFRMLQRLTVMGVFCALPLIHNLYFGRRFVLFSTSRAGGSLDISAAPDHLLRYLYIFTRPLKSADLTSQGIMGFPGSGYSKTLWTATVIFILIWIVTAIQAAKVGKIRKLLGVILAPLAYLLPIIPYHAYFPRHAVVFWLSLFVASAAIKESLDSKFGSEEKTFSNNPITHF